MYKQVMFAKDERGDGAARERRAGRRGVSAAVRRHATTAHCHGRCDNDDIF